MFSYFIITEASVGNITSLHYKMSLSESVVNSAKSWSEENLTNLFTDFWKILQMSEACTKLEKCDDLMSDSSLCILCCEPWFIFNRIWGKCRETDNFNAHNSLGPFRKRLFCYYNRLQGRKQKNAFNNKMLPWSKYNCPLTIIFHTTLWQKS